MLTRSDLEHELEWLERDLRASASAAARTKTFRAASMRLSGCALAEELAFVEASLALLRQKYGIADEAISMRPRRSRKRDFTRMFPIG